MSEGPASRSWPLDIEIQGIVRVRVLYGNIHEVGYSCGQNHLSSSTRYNSNHRKALEWQQERRYSFKSHCNGSPQDRNLTQGRSGNLGYGKLGLLQFLLYYAQQSRMTANFSAQQN